MAKDVADISGRLAIPRYTARAFDGTWTGIVCSYREVDHPKPVEHLPQVSYPSGEGRGVMVVGA